MIILASDTCTKSISAAVFEDGKVLASYTGDKGMTHSQTHMLLIEEVLNKSGKKVGQVDLFACTNGPGSFTGIRIGVTSTKTLAYACRKDAVGISALEVLAYPFKIKNTIVCPMLDARNRRVFAGGYKNGEIIIPEGNYLISVFLKKINDYIESGSPEIEKIVICGDAAGKYEQDPETVSFSDAFIQRTGEINFEFIRTDPDAADLAKIAYEKYTKEKIPGQDMFSPFLLNAGYLSPSSAERMKNKDAEGKTDR